MPSSVYALVCLGLLAAPARAAAITVGEPPDLANSVAAPTPIALDPGANTVSGTVATPGDRQDNFAITVPAGEMLTAVALTLDTTRGFIGSVTFNLSETLDRSGAFSMGLPLGPGTYIVQVITDFSVGNAWQTRFTVTGGPAPICGDGVLDTGEACDDGNRMSCDGCSDVCTVDLDGCAIDDLCLAEGAPSPTDACLVCRREVSRVGYSPAMAGTVCDDLAFCTTADACDGAGLCTGTAMACDDADLCTTDSCDEGADTCVHDPIAACGPDAGPSGEDAGTPGADAGPPGDDGGTSTRDAGTRSDAGTTGPGDEDSGGCGCGAVDRSPAFTTMLLIGVALVLGRRRPSRL
jgi:cysteine-rich repeat protein